MRGRLRPLGPVALPVALLLTFPSWVLVSALLALRAVWREHPRASTATLLVALGVGVVLGTLVLPGA